MSGSLRRRRGQEGESEATDGLVAALAWLDSLEVAVRNLLATRAQAAQLSPVWTNSRNLEPLATPLVAWLGGCAGEEMLEAIAGLRAGIEAEKRAAAGDSG
jgi:hypothetical protein